MNKVKELVSKNSADETVVVVVKRPNGLNQRKAKMYAGKIFAQAMKEKCPSRDNFSTWLRENGILTEENEAHINELRDKILKLNEELEELKEKYKDKKPTKKQSEVLKQKCIEVISLKNELIIFSMLVNQYSELTVEAQVNQAEHDFLVSECTFSQDGNRMFENVNDYLERSDEQFAFDAANALYEMINGENKEEKPLEEDLLEKFNLKDKEQTE